MNTSGLTELRKRALGVLQDARSGPVVVTRRGKPVAVLVHLKDTNSLVALFAPRGVSSELRRELADLIARRAAGTLRRRPR